MRRSPMHRLLRSLQASLVIAAIVVLSAPQLQADDVEDFVVARMQEQHLPGVAFAVLRRGEVLRSEALGFASLELRAPVSSGTIFQIGSLTKQFTARAVLLLADEGKLRLTDPIRKFVPDVPVSWNRITLYHLLTHTSGVPNWVGMEEFSFHSDYTSRQFLAIFADKPLDFAPGERFKYSSAGYSLLTFAIEKASGMPFSDFLRVRLFEPAGMHATSVNDSETVLAGRAEGYVVRNGAIYNGVNLRPRITAPSGAVLSTIDDLARWESVLLAGKDLLPESRALVVRPVKLNGGNTFHYGLGWYLRDAAKSDIVYHTGTTSAGFRSAYFRDLPSGITVIFLCNASGDGVEPLPIAESVARMYIERFQPVSQ
ncbi:MAG: serine hydrolase domain-containing protein [Bryobacterales bacterium]|nr:serine hydrolase domain-containing protein [Bryobacterales bacterium]